MRTDNKKNIAINVGGSENSEGVSAYSKVKTTLKAYPDTLELADTLFKRDNCRSRSEFIEKAVRFYCGYLLNKENAAMEFIAPQIKTMTDGIIKSSEQRLARAMFKIAVELGAVTHILAATNDINDETLFKLRNMCTDEVKRINGIINFEKAVRYQRSE
ncbi:MAG: hypothetical protein IJ555_02095 [Ruminococcus sp.]|nr:hypothetical protein [Ruminococcus sp.]